MAGVELVLISWLGRTDMKAREPLRWYGRSRIAKLTQLEAAQHPTHVRSSLCSFDLRLHHPCGSATRCACLPYTPYSPHSSLVDVAAMAERKSTNKYYPPDWDPSKGSLNTYHGSHPLRERASRLQSHGILVIRFEMPFAVHCLACHASIDKGVRFNADKQRVGQYFSTPLFSFIMRCPLCANTIRIDTDPMARDYAVVEGARRREAAAEERAEENGQLVVGVDEAEARQRATDVLARVERSAADERKARSVDPVLLRLLALNERMEDDFGQSQRLRAHSRKRREEWQAREAEREEKGLGMQLLPGSEEDRLEAEGRRYGRVETTEEGRKRRRKERSASRTGKTALTDSERAAARLQSERAVQPLTASSSPCELSDRPRHAHPQPAVVVRRRASERTAGAACRSAGSTPVNRWSASTEAMSLIVAYSSEDDDAS